MPIIVTGVGSSGTSMIAGILHKLGVSMGYTWRHVPPEGDKVWHRYEDTDFVFMNLLFAIKAPEKVIIDALRYLVRCKREPFGFKDPHISMNIPIYRKAIPDARWIWCTRNKKAIMDSLKRNWKMNFAKAILYTEGRIQRLKKYLPKDHYVARYEKFLKSPIVEVTKLADWLGVRLTQDAIDMVNKNVTNRST